MLEAQSVSKSFGGLAAVADVSLHVGEGEIVSLVGPNGAGKTTLFSILTGFLRPDRGRVLFRGEDVTGMKPHGICARGMVRTFQITQPFPSLSVLGNIMVGAYLRAPARDEAQARSEEVARSLGMGHMLGQRARDLTVAGRKRLELARALATRPRLLLLDEVMAGLNPAEIDEIVGVIRGIRDSGVTIFLIEHVMKAVARLSDRCHVLNDGHLIAEGTPQEIATDAAVVEAYLGHGAAGRMAAQGAQP